MNVPNCSYIITGPSVCSSSRSICNGRGLCGYDYGINSPKCFCFQDYGGDSCEGFSDIIFTPSQKPKPDLTDDLVFDFEATFVGIDQNGDVFETDVELIYDLRRFGVDPDEYYAVNDSAAYGQWVFYIGIGNPVDTKYLPGSCKVVESPCMDYDFVNKKCNHEIGLYMYNDTAYVYQYSAREGDCSLLGSEIGTTQLIDNVDDFAKGVRMTYIGGSYADGCQTPDVCLQIYIPILCLLHIYIHIKYRETGYFILISFVQILIHLIIGVNHIILKLMQLNLQH